MSAHGDFFPDSAQNIYDWTVSYLAELPAIATRISWPPASVTAISLALTAIRDAAKDVLDAQNVLNTKVGLLAQARVNHLPEVRLKTNNLKTTTGFTDGDAKTLEVQSGAAAFDAATYKAELKVKSHLGHNEITGKKRGVQALNLYGRVKGTGPWRLLASKRRTFPFFDDSPPAAGVATEEREYMAMGVMNDEEIGEASDIVSAVFRSL